MKIIHFFLIGFILLLVACSTTKNIPEGKFLLDQVNIKADNPIEGSSELETFIRQQPNGSLPLLGKIGLNIYNLAGKDTTKLFNRLIRKLGSEPVIYSPSLAATSASQLELEVKNLGYLNANVDTTLVFKKKKVKINYNIQTDLPYRVRNYTNEIKDTTILRISKMIEKRFLIHPGILFDKAILENERENLNLLFRNVGYYNFSKDYVYFKADTTLNSHQVDLYLNVYPTTDSLPHKRYKINDVTVVSGFRLRDTIPDRGYFRNPDSTRIKDFLVIRNKKNKFLRNSIVNRNNYLRKGMYYSDYLLSRTYENFNGLGAIQQTNINLFPSKDSLNLLDATIILTPANAHWFSAALEGTNAAGDFGVAPSVSYRHQNFFNGAEVFAVKLRGAYEFITGGEKEDLLSQNYFEYGVETSMTFPRFLFPGLRTKWTEQTGSFTKFSLGLTVQKRREYTRQFFNGTLGYGWDSKDRAIHHNFDLMDVNYIRMPFVSEKFRDQYLTDESKNQLLRASYENQLVARTSYSFTYVMKPRFSKNTNVSTIRGLIEVAGALPRVITTLSGAKANDAGSKSLFGVVYAEYVKGTGDFSRTIRLSSTHNIAFHTAFGAAYPYGNRDVLPFERRFFAGGSNSIRGWQTRSLGPGSYKSVKGGSNDFVNQTGDLKLEASIETRHKLTEMFEVAGFLDAGNIWTIKNYEGQPNGQFELNRFYKEIAVAYGLGLRFDLGFLLLRLDLGARAYDPGLDQSKRFVLLKPRTSRMALHFGIGYPF